MRSIRDSFTLANGVQIPCVGFGTWKTPDGDVAVSAVREALHAGYRHIDTASGYDNEASVGRALRESGLSRKEVFITSKLGNPDQGYDTTCRAFEATLSRLGTDYLDLYLIHWPIPHGHKADYVTLNRETWRAFEEFYTAGRIRAIGVSNFQPTHLGHLLDYAHVAPMVNQIEFHPGFTQEDTVAFCKKHDIQVEAWSPLGNGSLFQVPEAKAIAAHYGKTVAQVALRFCLQQDVLPLPKSTTPARIAENTALFDFDLTQEDIAALAAMTACGDSGLYPDTVTW